MKLIGTYLQGSYAISTLLTFTEDAYKPVIEFLIFVSSKMNILRSFQTWRRYRHTVNELNRLSIHELNDLGITRGDITSIARRAALRR